MKRLYIVILFLITCILLCSCNYTEKATNDIPTEDDSPAITETEIEETPKEIIKMTEDQALEELTLCYRTTLSLLDEFNELIEYYLKNNYSDKNDISGFKTKLECFAQNVQTLNERISCLQAPDEYESLWNTYVENIVALGTYNNSLSLLEAEQDSMEIKQKNIGIIKENGNNIAKSLKEIIIAHDIYEYYDKREEIEEVRSQTEQSLKPYLQQMGMEVTDNLTVSQSFLDNLNNVFVLGYVGTVEHGYTSASSTRVGYMDWIQNDNSSRDEFDSFLIDMQDYFKQNYRKESTEEVYEECYRWIDYDNISQVYAWFENNKINLRWYYDENISKSTKSSNGYIENDNSKSKEEIKTDSLIESIREIREINTVSNTSKSSSEVNSNTSNKQYEHVCQASGCNKEGTKKEMGLGGEYEYYCPQHYQEIYDILDKMERDVGSTGSSQSSQSSAVSDDEKNICWTLAKDTVKNNLKSPSSAKFPFSYGSEDVSITKSGSIYTVKSWVDADNSFGANIRSNFVVTISKNGTSFRVDGILID